MELLFATTNESKLKRFNKLEEQGIKLLSLKDLNVDINIDENGKNAIENAVIKAKAYYEKLSITTMAMDDNLYIENIPDDLQPGMYVRRVNGRRLSDDEMIDYYSNLAKTYGDNGLLTARWVYGIAIIKDGNIKTYTWSKDDFYISSKISPKRHIGYPLDSISINKKLNKYFTDITNDTELDYNEDHVINFIINNVF
jgi:XTP/dITP diphosphohydrolase